jgi:polyphosphate kinase
MTAEASPRVSDQYSNRELSWLDFNQRVLAQAADERHPLFERLKFVAIWAENLDEFFQVRVAGLKDQVDRGRSNRSPDGRTPSQTLAEIRTEIDLQLTEVSKLYESLLSELEQNGISVVGWDDLTVEERDYLGQQFEDRIFPVLTPLAVDLGHPFPYISNLSLSLGVILRDPVDQNRRFARLKVPQNFERFVALPEGGRFIPIEAVVFAHVELLFPGMEVVEAVAFRVTRNADLDIDIDEDEVSNLLSAVEIELRRRRFRQAVRLQFSAGLTIETRELLTKELELGDDDVYVADLLLNLGDLWQLVGLDRPELRYDDHVPVTPAVFTTEDDEPADLFAVLRDRDVLVHHPYESFLHTVDELLRQASVDRDVQAIKMTLYRTSGDSPLVDHLIRAAEAGKQVAVVVELKARFDEAANIAWARRLEDAGVHVAYGLVGLKVHAKTLLIVRSEGASVRRYSHVGTGNYNSRTALLYTDLALMTSDPAIGRDLTHIFNSLTGYGRGVHYTRLEVAPDGLRSRIQELIAGEAAQGESGHITMKMNALVDPDLIDALYEASRAGVRIDLMVRGICCLRPGVEGLSPTITVRSLIGRFLEHSRVYRFANGSGEGLPLHLMGSADLMPRNLDRRVEALVPITEPELRERIDELLDLEMADEYLAWDLGPEGSWRRLNGDPATNSQALLIERASS